MINLNTAIETKVEVDMMYKGSTSTPRLRMLFYTMGFFIGFDGSHNEILIPKLDKIAWSESQIHAKIEVLIDEFTIVLWEDDVHLISEKVKKAKKKTKKDVTGQILPQNKIKIKVNFEDEQIKKTKIKAIPDFDK